MKRIAFIASAVAGALLGASPISAFAQAAAGDAKAGAQLLQRCQGCHGIDGWRTAFPEVYKVPKIGGQHTAYFVSALKAYKSGERKNAGMRSIASALSEKDMADLAAYYAEVK
jgi:cytochrome c553